MDIAWDVGITEDGYAPFDRVWGNSNFSSHPEK